MTTLRLSRSVLAIADGIYALKKISFNPKARGRIVLNQDGDVVRAKSRCAFEPVMVMKTGVDAIMEGLRLADVEGFDAPARWAGSPSGGGDAEDVDATDRLKRRFDGV